VANVINGQCNKWVRQVWDTTRALSYQAYDAFLNFRHQLDANTSPPSYGTDNESKYYKQRRLMKESFNRDMAEEVDGTEGAEVDDD
jgi:hypothetical protein